MCGCNVNNPAIAVNQNTDTDAGTWIYTLSWNGSNIDLKRSRIDTLNFTSTGISVDNDLTTSTPKMFDSPKNNILLIATEKKLYFIDKSKKTKTKELSIPDTDNPEEYFGYGKIDILPYKANSDYCILINRSVYLINLKTFQIEKTIWNSYDANNYVFIYDAALSADSSKLFLQLTYYKYIIFQKIMALDLLDNSSQIIYEYKEGDLAPKGSKYVYCNSDYLISYSASNNVLTRLAIPSYNVIDSIVIDKKLIPYSLLSPNNNEIIVQDYTTGSFSSLNCENMQLSDILNLSIGPIVKTRFQSLMGGDLYASTITTLGKCSVYNLTKSKLIFEFNNDYRLYDLIIMEE